MVEQKPVLFQYGPQKSDTKQKKESSGQDDHLGMNQSNAISPQTMSVRKHSDETPHDINETHRQQSVRNNLLANENDITVTISMAFANLFVGVGIDSSYLDKQTTSQLIEQLDLNGVSKNAKISENELSELGEQSLDISNQENNIKSSTAVIQQQKSKLPTWQKLKVIPKKTFYEEMEKNESTKQKNMKRMSTRMLILKNNGVFYVKDKEYQFSVKSLYCLGSRSKFRVLCVKIMINPWFDRFITLCIILNSILLASKEFDKKYNEKYESTWNNLLDQIDVAFSIIFLLECLIKICAMGFFKHKNSYLRDPWNWMDLFIVIISVVSMTPGLDQSSLKALRTARVLRPLRSMGQLKSMRSLLETFFASIPGLLNVCIFMTFIFTIFAIISINFFVGAQYQFCRSTETVISNENQEPYWPKNEDAQWQCRNDDMCSGYPNYLGKDTLAKCGDIFRDYDLDPTQYDQVRNNEMINYDITNFNDVVSAALTVFQIITLEGWAQLMYNYQDSVGYTTSSIFFLLVIIIGAFTSLNLILAAIMQSYLSKEEDRKEKERIAKIKQNVKKEIQSSSPGLPKKHEVITEPSVIDDPLKEKVITMLNNKQESPAIIDEGDKDDQGQDDGVDGLKSRQHQYSSKSDLSGLNLSLKREEENQSNQVQDILISEKGQQQVHLPSLHGKTQQKFFGILAHQQLENEISKEDKSEKDSNDDKKFGSIIVKNSIAVDKSNCNPSPISPSKSQEELFKDKKIQKVGIGAESSQIESYFQMGSPNDNSSEKPLSEFEEFADQKQIIDTVSIEMFTEAKIHVEDRSDRNRIYKFFFDIVTSVSFNFLIYCFILTNTITLALFRFDQSDKQAEVLQIFEIIFVWVFFAEMVSKLIGLGVKNYSKDRFNLFDGLIVIISLIDFSLMMSLDAQSSVDGIMSALRALRLLRVVKLARHWKAFQDILVTMMSSLYDISSFTLLLLLTMYIFALLGMELFAFSVFEDDSGNYVFGEENIKAAYESGQEMTWARNNFNNVFNAMVTVFTENYFIESIILNIVIVAEDWNIIMYLYVRALDQKGSSGRIIALSYFLGLMIIGNIILLALFTALLLKKGDQESNQKIQGMILKREKEIKLKFTFERQKTIGLGQSIRFNFTRQKARTKWTSFCDYFVKIFGGESAFDKRQKSHQLKPDFSSVSPSMDKKVSGKLKSSELVFQALSNIGEKQTAKKGNILDNYAEKETTIIKKKSLQRPASLLHYDYQQVSVVIDQNDQLIEEERRLHGKSLFIFKASNPIRKLVYLIIKYWLFESFILLMISASSLTLAFEHPMEDPASQKFWYLNLIDKIMTGIFCVEALMKIITFGFIFNGKSSYLRDSWNILDFSIVIISLISMSIIDSDVSFIKVLRVARILRPLRALRLIQHVEGLKVAIQALFKAIPQIIRLQVVVFFCIFMISILMTSLLSGKLFRCELGHTQLTYQQQGALVFDYWDCVNYGGEWTTPDMNFDDTLKGVLTLFIFQTREGWVDLMYDSVDANGVNLQPMRDNNPYYIILYVFLVIIIILLFVNMFVRVVIQTYQLEKNFLNYNSLLSQEQRSWAQVQILTYSVKPIPVLEASSGSVLRNYCIKISCHRYFDKFIMFCIILNTIVMALVQFDESHLLSWIIEIINYTFAAIFTIEAVIKIIALKKQYFNEPWNIFDFTIVMVTFIFLLLGILEIPIVFGNGATILRIIRIGRVLRLARKAHKLQVIFQTLLDSAASLGSLGLLLIILTFIFAIVGRSLFGLAKIGDPNKELNEHANFRDFFDSFLLLMRCSTGESWHIIMFELAKTYSLTYQCREDENYETMMANGEKPYACGSQLVSYTFFVFFQILISQIFVNLFIAIIIDGFLGNSDTFKLPVQQYSIFEFVMIWQKYDQQATGFIDIADLDKLIKDLAQSYEGKDLVILSEKIAGSKYIRRRFISMLSIPTYCQLRKVMFYDTLQQLCAKINLVKFNQHKLKEISLQGKVLKLLGGINMDELSLIMNFDNGVYNTDFDQTILNMGKLNPKINLMLQLKKGFIQVHNQHVIYADTEGNMHLTDQERRQMSYDQLKELATQNALQHDDLNIFTTKHYYFGNMIAKAWKMKKAHRIDLLNSEYMNQASQAMQMNLPQKVLTPLASVPVIDVSHIRANTVQYNETLSGQRSSPLSQTLDQDMQTARNISIQYNPKFRMIDQTPEPLKVQQQNNTISETNSSQVKTAAIFEFNSQISVNNMVDDDIQAAQKEYNSIEEDILVTYDSIKENKIKR